MEALWKHEGENRCAFLKDRAQSLRPGRGRNWRDLRNNSQAKAIIHALFGTAHNLKVTGSNPVPATKFLHHIKRLKASLTGGFLRSSTPGSTVEARGDAMLRGDAQS